MEGKQYKHFGFHMIMECNSIKSTMKAVGLKYIISLTQHPGDNMNNTYMEFLNGNKLGITLN